MTQLEKMEAWLQKQEAETGKSAEEWQASFPFCAQAAYRSGMWWAYHEAVRHVLTLKVPTDLQDDRTEAIYRVVKGENKNP